MTDEPRRDEIQIRNACHRTWESLEPTGDAADGRRYCDECRLHVHDSVALTRDEAHALVRGTEQRVCMRIVPDATGAPLYKDSPRLAKIAGWALVTGASLLAACRDDAGRNAGPGAGTTRGAGGATESPAPPPEAMGLAAVGTLGEALCPGEPAAAQEPVDGGPAVEPCPLVGDVGIGPAPDDHVLPAEVLHEADTQGMQAKLGRVRMTPLESDSER